MLSVLIQVIEKERDRSRSLLEAICSGKPRNLLSWSGVSVDVFQIPVQGSFVPFEVKRLTAQYTRLRNAALFSELLEYLILIEGWVLMAEFRLEGLPTNSTTMAETEAVRKTPSEFHFISSKPALRESPGILPDLSPSILGKNHRTG